MESGIGALHHYNMILLWRSRTGPIGPFQPEFPYISFNCYCGTTVSFFFQCQHPMILHHLDGPWFSITPTAWNCPTYVAFVYDMVFFLTSSWSNHSVLEILPWHQLLTICFLTPHCMEHCMLVAKILIWIHCLGQTFWTVFLSSDIAICPTTSNACTVQTWRYFKL